MKLIVIVICLLSERFLIHAWSYQRFSWFADYCKKVIQTIESNNNLSNPYIILAAIVLPLVIAVGLIYFLFHNLVFGFFGLILSIAIFFYCLGPQNAFYPISNSDEPNDSLVSQYFAQVNPQLFALLFWYIVAGPIAALAYRLIYLSTHIEQVEPQATEVANILEWIPARLTGLLFLLVGNFQKSITLYVSYLFAKPSSNSNLLSECGLQAVRSSENEPVPMPVAESLVEQAVIVFVVLIALFTLVAWM